MKTFRLFFFISLLLVLSACTLSDDITPPPGARQVVYSSTPVPASPVETYPLTAPNLENGQAIYAEKCAPCHGDTGLGDGPDAAGLPNPVAALGDPEAARGAAPAEWHQIVTKGNIQRYMPPFSSLTEGQKWDVVAYALSLSTSQTELAAGAELYQANCAGCHGETGAGDGPQAAGSEPDFTNLSLWAERSTAKFHEVISAGAAPDMPAFGDELEEDQIWALANYLRTFSYAPAGETPAGETASVQPTAETEAAPETGMEAGTEITATETVSSTTDASMVTGTVLNGVTGEPLSDLTVTLHGFDGMQIALTETVQTNADGVYTFTGIEMSPDRVFLSFIEYGGATYASNVQGLPLEGGPLTLDINAYETTTDISALKVDRLHIFFDFTSKDAGVVQVIELYIISNPTMKAVVGEMDGDPITPFSVPEGAANLQFQDGELGGRYLETPEGFADTLPVRPNFGEYQVLYAFDLPYEGKLELNQNVLLPVDSVILLVPEEGMQVKGSGLEDAGARDMQGESFHMYTGSGLAAGSQLSFTISGAGSFNSLLTTLGNNILLVVLGSLGLVLIAAGIVLYQRSRAQEDEDDGSGDLEEDSDDPDSLVDAIIALDDQYREGKLPEEAYRGRRAQLKERLKAARGE